MFTHCFLFGYNCIILFFNYNLVETTIYRISNCYEQKVRYAHHVVHWIEHVDNDSRPLPTRQVVYGRVRTSQSNIYSHIFHRVSTENICSALLLL